MTSRFFVFATSPGAMPLSRSSSTVFFLRAMLRLFRRLFPSRGVRRTRSCSVLLDPALDVALRGHAHGQRSGGDVLADDGACTGLRTCSQLNGRDENRV